MDPGRRLGTDLRTARAAGSGRTLPRYQHHRRVPRDDRDAPRYLTGRIPSAVIRSQDLRASSPSTPWFLPASSLVARTAWTRETVVLHCPDCGSPIQTLDLPCPVCMLYVVPDTRRPHKYSKTFEQRTAYRYRPDDFVASINVWLCEQRTLERLGADILLDRQGLVRGVTLHCTALGAPAGDLPVRGVFRSPRSRVRAQAPGPGRDAERVVGVQRTPTSDDSTAG